MITDNDYYCFQHCLSLLHQLLHSPLKGHSLCCVTVLWPPSHSPLNFPVVPDELSNLCLLVSCPRHFGCVFLIILPRFCCFETSLRTTFLSGCPGCLLHLTLEPHLGCFQFLYHLSMSKVHICIDSTTRYKPYSDCWTDNVKQPDTWSIMMWGRLQF